MRSPNKNDTGFGDYPVKNYPVPGHAASFQKNKQRLHGFFWPLFFCLACTWQTAFAETQTEVSAENHRIKQILATKQHPFLLPSDFSNRSQELDALYKLNDYQFIWLGQPSSEKNTADLLSILADAPSQGLNPDTYNTLLLREKLPEALLQPHDTANKVAGDFDTALSLSLLRYLHDIQYGRINPQSIHYKLRPKEKNPQAWSHWIKNHINQSTLLDLPALAEPKLKQYRQLKSALAAYRELAKTTPALHLAVNTPLRPGAYFPQAAELRQFLYKTGDMATVPAYDATAPDRYTVDLVAAVKTFQSRHGLAADGVIGPTTLTELNIPLSRRVTQIELAMERTRWLPEFSSGPAVIVNIPAFQLWAFDDLNALTPEATTMKVVVGQALKTQTPVLMAEISQIDFMPYWNVPYSITKNELIPKLLRDPSHLAREGMEVVVDSKPIGFSVQTLALLKEGKARVRQLPGKKNALGKIKFLFPNDDNVYLHDTPANALFNRSRRDFSHGCVRVEKPEILAAFALKGQGVWDAEKIQTAIHAGKNKRVTLKQPIPVLFFYTTAAVNQDNQLTFYPDIYDHDTALLNALRAPAELPDHNTVFAQPNLPAMPQFAEKKTPVPGQ